MSASGGSTHAPVRCLYVALDIPRDASPVDIKKAYRKQALAWHPDKNVGNEAEARVRFQELQHAYAVLSDPHERRWYDDHRDEILNPERYADGGDDGHEGGRGRTVNLTKFFSAAAFTGFGDNETGFYQTYAKAFREVWESERDWGEASSAEGGWGRGDVPEMGRSTDAYEVAEAFYSSWSEFVSRLSFGWVDEYNINEAENRRVRRLMEKENAKKRAVAKKKYQDDVRALVDFCRRRDRRVIKHKLALAKEKEERERIKKEAARAKREDLKRRKEEWARVREAELAAEEEARALEGPEKAFRVGETDSEEEEKRQQERGDRRKRRGKRRASKRGGVGGEGHEQEATMTVFRCAVCKKDFKSQGQMSNHETSKAHKKKMEELDAQMLREALASDSVEGEDDEDVDSNDDYVHDNNTSEKDVDGDESEDDFFVDSTRRELWESERSVKDGGALGAVGSGEAFVAGGGTRASEKGVRYQRRSVAKTNDSRGRPFDFGGRGDSSGSSGSSSSSSSSSDSGKDGDSDSEEDQGLLAAFAKVSVAPADEGSDQEDGRDDSSHNDSDSGKKTRCETQGLVEGTTLSRTEKTHQEVAPKPVKPFSAGLSGAETANENDCGGGGAKEHRGKGKDGKGDDGKCGDGKGDGEVKGTGHSAGEGSDGSVHGVVADRDVGLHEGSLEPSGKRGRRKAKEGKCVTGSTKVGESGPAAGDKGARRRRRQAAKASAKEDRGKGGEEDDGLGCRVCGKCFPSRSKLFAHVKSEGHAVLG